MNIFRLLCLLSFLAFLAACAPLSGQPDGSAPQASAQSPSPAAGQAKRPAGTLPVQEQRDLIEGHLATGDNLAALELIERQVRRGAAESDYLFEYTQALNGLLQKARRHTEQDEPLRAGRAFRKALELYPSDPGIASGVDMAPPRIEWAIGGISEDLMKKGLVAYRGGHLDRAIDLWEQILTFAPSHQPAIKAIRTAKIQLKNLESIAQD